MTFHDIVAKKAYELYQRRLTNKVVGDEVSDWFTAQKELIAAHYRGM